MRGIESELEILKKLMKGGGEGEEEDREQQEDGEEEDGEQQDGEEEVKQSEGKREEKWGRSSWVQTAVLCHTQASHLCSQFPSKHQLSSRCKGVLTS